MLIFTKMIKGFFVTLFFTAIVHNAVADARLIMVTSEHCPIAKRGNVMLVRSFKSAYAAKLPLTRVEIGSKMPKNISLKSRLLEHQPF